MSNFICEKCGIYIREGYGGHYVTGCEHYPIEKMNQPDTNNEAARLRELLTEFYDTLDIGGYHHCLCNIQTEDPEKWDLGCNCEISDLKKKYIELMSTAPAPEEPSNLHSAIKVIREKMSPEKAEEVRKIRLLIGEEELEQIANTPEPSPEWRELGPDEVICEGDEEWHPKRNSWIACGSFGSKPSEYNPIFRFRTRRQLLKSENLLDREPTEKQPEKSEDLNGDLWRIRAEGERMENGDQVKVWDEWTDWGGTLDRSWMVGEFWKEGEVRTRRPLPKQEEKTGYCEPAPECPNCKNNTMVWQTQNYGNDWMCHRAGCHVIVKHAKRLPKQEEMPLGRELKLIDELTGTHPWNEVYSCLRYLRDEIQKLKEAR